MKKIFIFLLLTFSFTASICYAEIIAEASPPAKNDEAPFGKYVTSYDHVKRLFDYAKQMDAKLGNQCDAEYNVPPGKVRIISPVAFSPTSPHPIKGLWAHRFKLERCGYSRVYNLYMKAQSKGAPTAIPMIMGDTATSMQVAQSALSKVFLTAYTKATDKCSQDEFIKSAFIAGSQFIKRYSDTINGKKIDGIWDEKWIVKACNTEIPVAITFVPEAPGKASFTVQ